MNLNEEEEDEEEQEESDEKSKEYSEKYEHKMCNEGKGGSNNGHWTCCGDRLSQNRCHHPVSESESETESQASNC